MPGDWIAGPMVVMGAPDEMGVETDIPEDLADEIIAMEHLYTPATGTGPGTFAMTPEEVRDLFDKAQELEERADSYGAREEDYAVADEAWNEAFEAAEQLGGLKSSSTWRRPMAGQHQYGEKPRATGTERHRCVVSCALSWPARSWTHGQRRPYPVTTLDRAIRPSSATSTHAASLPCARRSWRAVVVRPGHAVSWDGDVPARRSWVHVDCAWSALIAELRRHVRLSSLQASWQLVSRCLTRRHQSSLLSRPVERSPYPVWIVSMAQAAKPRPYVVSSGWDEDWGSAIHRRSGVLAVRLKPRRQLLGHHLATPRRRHEPGLPGHRRLQRQHPHDRRDDPLLGAGYRWIGQDCLGHHAQRASGVRADVLGNEPIGCLHGDVPSPCSHRSRLASHSSWNRDAGCLPNFDGLPCRAARTSSSRRRRPSGSRTTKTWAPQHGPVPEPAAIRRTSENVPGRCWPFSFTSLLVMIATWSGWWARLRRSTPRALIEVAWPSSNRGQASLAGRYRRGLHRYGSPRDVRCHVDSGPSDELLHAPRPLYGRPEIRTSTSSLRARAAT